MITCNEGLFEAVAGAGFYPGVALAQVRRLVGQGRVRGGLVVTDVTIDTDEGVQMEMQALAVTDEALLCWGAYEQAGTDADEATGAGAQPALLHSHSRVIPLSRVHDVRVISTVSDPSSVEPEDVPDAVRVIIALTQMDRLDVEPVGCGEEGCTGSHGMVGEVIHDALVFAESRESVGAAKLAELLDVAALIATKLGRG